MKPYGTAVTDASSARQNKRAIDSLYRALRPHYLMILGSIDVIPHQDPKNPVFIDDQEDDPVAWGDLPYACDAPYSRDITKFIGPTRVIGRLPDMSGASEPSHLLACLNVAATYTARPLAQYLNYFSLSARVWEKSTALSLMNVFGNAGKLLLAPPTTSMRREPQARGAQPLHQLPRRTSRFAFLRRRQERYADRSGFEGRTWPCSRRHGCRCRVLLRR